MSYFNEDQLDYMRSMAEIEPSKRCWCGWYRLGECPNCKTYAPNKTCADKIATWCPECHNNPGSSGGIITHSISCSKNTQ